MVELSELSYYRYCRITAQKIEVIKFIEALREVLPITLSSGWSLASTHHGLRCWKRKLPKPLCGAELTLSASTTKFEVPAVTVLNVVADVNSWPEWDPQIYKHLLQAELSEDPQLHGDAYMQSDQLVSLGNPGRPEIYRSVITLMTFSSCIALYADDIIIWVSKNNLSDAEQSLNKAMKNLQKVTQKLKLSINTNKSEIGLFTINNHLRHWTPNIFLNNSKLQYSDSPRYLGVTLDPALTFKKHIDTMISKAKNRFKILKKISGLNWGANANILRTTYLALVRPILEYATPAWINANTALKDININSPHTSKIIIYSDSRAAIYTLQSCFSSQEPLLKSIAKSVNRLPANSSVTVQWLPAHVGIPGNELADSLAKAGALGLPEARESTTQLDERDLLHTIKTQCLQEWKSDAAHDWYRAGGTSTGTQIYFYQLLFLSVPPNSLLYGRFGNLESNGTAWILLWNVDKLCWWFYLGQPVESSETSCIVSLIHGHAPRKGLTKDKSGLLASKLSNLKDALAATLYTSRPFHSPLEKRNGPQVPHLPAVKTALSDLTPHPCVLLTPDPKSANKSPGLLTLVPFSMTSSNITPSCLEGFVLTTLQPAKSKRKHDDRPAKVAAKTLWTKDSPSRPKLAPMISLDSKGSDTEDRLTSEHSESDARRNSCFSLGDVSITDFEMMGQQCTSQVLTEVYHSSVIEPNSAQPEQLPISGWIYLSKGEVAVSAEEVWKAVKNPHIRLVYDTTVKTQVSENQSKIL
ncbi:hypothetical protein LAZ67_9002909 [Cordylochernes scorpioides]|uniref:RNase H type-1 domain-containing protein n=1 Tax=Cordylochernes scorpioides TaxID=51811 RepID=A0ABY6KU86_9ARAC|nr:hypothetical protein LAZ67_9002909 [Cordylochernes scorpioides]